MRPLTGGLILIGLLALNGCGRRGETIAVVDGVLYRDEAAFRTRVDRQEAGVPGPPGEVYELAEQGKITALPKARIKVVERLRGGARVVVLDGKRAGEVGWMLDSTLDLGKAADSP